MSFKQTFASFEIKVFISRDLDEFEVKGRDIFVKWRDDGVWICPDPTCQMRNFLVRFFPFSK